MSKCNAVFLVFISVSMRKQRTELLETRVKTCSDRVQACIEAKLISGTGDLMLCVPRPYQMSAYMQFLLFWEEKMRTRKNIYWSGFAVVLPVFCVNGDLRENYTVPAFMEVKLKVGQVISCCVSPVSIRYWRVCNLYCLGPKDEDEEELLVKQLCCCFACLCENYTILAFKVKSGAHAVRPNRYPMSENVQCAER